ncbi:MAG: ABC transporter substrate-binding protein [Phycisphaeraceae bacterium]|nr:ABC transporter substrate-binding protein [Phycisphaeraceae bacterium]
MRWYILMLLCVIWWAVGPAVFSQAQRVESAESHTPQRIITLAPNLTEIVYGLGLGDQVVAVTQFSDFPEAVQSKPKVGSFWQLNLEAIVGRQPDLVLALGFTQQRDLARRLRRMHVPVETFNIEDFNDLLTVIEGIGKITERPLQAAVMVESLQAELAAVQEKVRHARRPRVLWSIQREPLRVAGRKTFVNWIIENAGGTNAIGPTLHQYPPVGAEQVLACQPEVIIEQLMVQRNPTEQLKQAKVFWQRYEHLPAVQSQRIGVLDDDLVARMGPRIVEGVRATAEMFHPDLFGVAP